MPLHTRRMTAPYVRLGFFKLNVADMEPALAFWRDAFGFSVTMSFDQPDFSEHVLSLPGQEGGPNLMLVAYKDGRDAVPGSGHGAVGLICNDLTAAYERATSFGATTLTRPFEAEGVKIALLLSPQGHEIELIQLPAWAGSRNSAKAAGRSSCASWSIVHCCGALSGRQRWKVVPWRKRWPVT